MPRTSANRSRNVRTKPNHRNAVPSLLEAPDASGRQSTSAAPHCISGVSPSPGGALDVALEDVEEFLYDATAYMRDVDEAATQGTNSPPSFDDTSGELDGINGRSFQHPMQRKMQQERMEADTASRRHPEAPSTSQFLDHPNQQNHIQPQPAHPPLLHLLHHQVHVPQVPFPHQEPAAQPLRSESSLAHALDESRIQRTTPSNSSQQPQPSWEHPLAYPHQPNSSSHEILSAHPCLYDGSSAPSSAGLSAQAGGVSFIKAERWDDDPNAYLIHASEETSYYNTPFSCDPTRSSDPAEWVTTLSSPAHYPYPYHQDHMQ